jgi:hypothetical protein
MIISGVRVLNEHVSDEFRILSDEDIVRMIFVAMMDRQET